MAEVVDGRILEEGTWTFADGRVVKGVQEMVLGADFVEVVTGFEVHRYAFVDEVLDGWDFAAEYLCGPDIYRIHGKTAREGGWKMEMQVKGPRKNEVQVVEYAQI